MSCHNFIIKTQILFPFWEANCLVSQTQMFIKSNTSPCLKPNKSSPHFFIIEFNIILPSLHRPPKWSLPFRFHNETFVCIYHFSRTFEPPLSDHPNICELYITRSSSALCSCLPLQSKYPPKHFVLKHPQFELFTQCESPHFTLLNVTTRVITVVYILTFTFLASKKEKRFWTEWQ